MIKVNIVKLIENLLSFLTIPPPQKKRGCTCFVGSRSLGNCIVTCNDMILNNFSHWQYMTSAH